MLRILLIALFSLTLAACNPMQAPMDESADMPMEEAPAEEMPMEEAPAEEMPMEEEPAAE